MSRSPIDMQSRLDQLEETLANRHVLLMADGPSTVPQDTIEYLQDLRAALQQVIVLSQLSPQEWAESVWDNLTDDERVEVARAVHAAQMAGTSGLTRAVQDADEGVYEVRYLDLSPYTLTKVSR